MNRLGLQHASLAYNTYMRVVTREAAGLHVQMILMLVN